MTVTSAQELVKDKGANNKIRLKYNADDSIPLEHSNKKDE